MNKTNNKRKTFWNACYSSRCKSSPRHFVRIWSYYGYSCLPSPGFSLPQPKKFLPKQSTVADNNCFSSHFVLGDLDKLIAPFLMSGLHQTICLGLYKEGDLYKFWDQCNFYHALLNWDCTALGNSQKLYILPEEAIQNCTVVAHKILASCSLQPLNALWKTLIQQNRTFFSVVLDA